MCRTVQVVSQRVNSEQEFTDRGVRMVWRRWKHVIAVTAGTLLLTGCIDLDADLTLNSKAEATGTYEVTMAKAVASMLGVTSAKDLEKALLENSEINLPAGNSVKVRDAGLTYVMTVTMKDVELDDSEFAATVQPDGNIRFVFKNEGSGGESEDLDLNFTAGSITMRIKFPGRIVDTGPLIVRESDRVAVLEASLSQSVDTFVVSEPGSGSSSGDDRGGSSAVVIGAVSAVAVLIAGAVAVRAQRRKRQPRDDSGFMPPPV
jgi:hypothetical protein